MCERRRRRPLVEQGGTKPVRVHCAKSVRLHPTIDHRLNAGPPGHAACRTSGNGPWLVQTGSPPKVAASRLDKTICTGDGLASSYFKCAMIRAHPTVSACSRFASTHGARPGALLTPALARPALGLAEMRIRDPGAAPRFGFPSFTAGGDPSEHGDSETKPAKKCQSVPGGGASS